MVIACRNIVGIIVLLLFVASVYAQPRCKVEYYTAENGLSHEAVNYMLKDKEGFMWFGTWDGINRFDGRSFVSYKSAPGDQSHLGNDRIDQIIEDQDDHLWILAYDRQVYRFDKKLEQFQPLSQVINPDGKQKITFSKILHASNGRVWLQSVNNGLYCIPQTDLRPERVIHYPVSSINFFHNDGAQRIWVGTREGLRCFTPSDAGEYKSSDVTVPAMAGNVEFTTALEDASVLYFGTAGGHLVRFDKKANTFSVWPIANDRIQGLCRSKGANVIYASTGTAQLIACNLTDKSITADSYPAAKEFISIYEDKSGILWLESRLPGVVRYNTASHTFAHFSNTITDRLNIINNRVKVWEDNNGLVWVFMKGGGFGYYNNTTGNFGYLLNTPDAGLNKLSDKTYAVLYDKAGIFWVTTNERQLIKIMLQSNVFEQQLLAAQPVSKFDNEVRGIYYDTRERLWVGAKNGKLYVYDQGNQLSSLFDNEPPEGLGLVYSIMQDSKGNMWLGTKANGLFKATPVNSEASKYHLTHFLPGNNNGNLQCKDVYSLLEDKQGRIWIGSYDNGLFLVQEEQGRVQFTAAGELFKNYPKDAFHKIRHLAQDAAGNLWIGTTNGLLLLNRNGQAATQSYAVYRKIAGDKNSLGNNDIQFVYRDAKNRMWLATSGGGFCEAIGDNPFEHLQFRNYTTRDGMPNDYVLSCAEDAHGKLWLATENGLSRFDPDKIAFRNYDSYDGLPRAGFSEAAVCRRLPNGQLVFGTTRGMLIFDPARISSERITANIAFTRLQINNEEAVVGTNEAVLTNAVNYTEGLTLKYDQNIISIDYAILDQRVGNRPGLLYRLLGFDSTWHNDGQQRRTTYTNLPPGKYVFEVKSLSTDLYSNTPYKRMAITILPPPWKTWWAYLLYILFIAVLLFFIRRYAIAMIRLRNKVAIEKKLAAMKENFFTNISHELRTPLTLIINPIEQLSRKEKLSPEGAAWVHVARRNASRMVRFINQLLDLRKVESNQATLHRSWVEMVQFVKKISEHFSEALKSKQLTLEVVSEEQELYASVDAEKLDIVIFNLLANAVKFTPENKTITIRVAALPAEESFLIAVSDQGPGVDKTILNNIFDLFYEGEHAGRAQKGSGIGLALSKELVHLHGGSIWAENNEQGGLTVSVKIKLGTAGAGKQGEPQGPELHDEPLYPDTPDEYQLAQTTSSVLTPPVTPDAPLVLLVEDNDELRTFLSSQLSEFYRVEVAANGEEGWQKAGEVMPDLILSDIMMPVMDGIQMLDKIKNDINTSHIPVVLLSAKHSIESRIEGVRYGADCYITKPFHNEYLIASIENLLRQRKKLFETLVSKKPFTELSPSPIVVTSADELFLKDVIRVVEEKMTDPGFSMETVAESMSMSRSAFYKKFKSLTGLTTVEFVRDMRLQRARQYLDGGQTNIAEVAYWSGFNNPKYFSTCFREKYQVSPTDYLKSKDGYKL
jgi:signal transduction histidine kinase/ligand-binding sensor domain-containing protein/DNA-binding response OmpR family regulator